MPSRIVLVLIALLLSTGATEAIAARCLYVSSYHSGYTWNDEIEQSIETILAGKCELRKFYMDGKRHLEAEFARQKAREAMDLIGSWHPDVVIAADDNASKYLVMPYLKNGRVPVVFCGINWTADAYGYPYDNATGMIEVGPIDELVAEVRRVVPGATRGIYLSADEMTQDKEADLFKKAYGRYGITIVHVPVRTMAEWEKSYLAAQSTADFLIIGNNAGITNWDSGRAKAVVSGNSRRFSVTYLDWMTTYSMLGMAKIAGEQGEWAA
ncbi:MAG: hypothetical protein M0017_04740, partial [Desulfobacteraceae bacterium]|nr:hypothetical protein [Desulfobacteraceae bacterium]